MRLLSLLKVILGVLALSATTLMAQDDDDLLKLLGEEEEPQIEYVKASFKTNRVINAHSLENTAGGVLDVKISHRFGYLNSGWENFFGIDNATVRLGADYGITDWLGVGFGRNSFEKLYDGYIKAKILRQSTGKRKMPVTLAYVAAMAVKTTEWSNPERENYFTSRLFYTHQLIIGRRFSEAFSLQLMPTLVHRNLVATLAEKNDVFVMGIAGRQKITKRIAFNAEYFYIFPNQVAADVRNSLSLGLDIETGGHVFQLHFTNSNAMNEKGFITETAGKWLDGDVHFGFNISRVFTLAQKKTKR
ncbi:MAG TPA: DUF5777 family beta-barrel protein [Chitinophagales bacterium]|nr:DUF5777 family beta-barrel protein [Chitinophagales bacterium]HRK25865.1 DUF5777 family beta-barrel protein [Chitinophagales bacterium]